ncbi:MAG: polymer-forming cytoskeletal protein [Bacteroidetes bacterium]|nr:polymer-forming cytoskeletal protein [Bacteroidota bacterium]
MLTTKEQKRAADEISNSSNVIGKGTTLEGNIETHGNIRVEGRVIGNVKSKSKIALGHGSHVEGNIVAQNADIEGEVKGKVDITELLVLKSTAVVHGDIATGKLVVEPGAIFNGNCRMGTVKDIKLSDTSGVRSPQAEARMN